MGRNGANVLRALWNESESEECEGCESEKRDDYYDEDEENDGWFCPW
jgi:hypothetical protein